MSVDVEDYFQVSAFADSVAYGHWDRYPQRVVRNTEIVLELLDETRSTATFFVLGWVAERYPSLVQRITAHGHEVASHGYAHRRVSEQTPEQFHEDVARTKRVLEDVAGTAVRGYRAASFSLDGSMPWAYDILAASGYTYSSSIYPIRHDHYGEPDAPRSPHNPSATAAVVELPLATIRIAERNLPCAGGGYFRLIPYALSAAALRRVNRAERRPCIFYFHPWEIDPDQPRIRPCPLRTRTRHYVNLARMHGKLQRLLTDFRWDRLDRVYRLDEPPL